MVVLVLLAGGVTLDAMQTGQTCYVNDISQNEIYQECDMVMYLQGHQSRRVYYQPGVQVAGVCMIALAIGIGIWDLCSGRAHDASHSQALKTEAYSKLPSSFHTCYAIGVRFSKTCRPHSTPTAGAVYICHNVRRYFR
jgi:hypothetical protein